MAPMNGRPLVPAARLVGEMGWLTVASSVPVSCSCLMRCETVAVAALITVVIATPTAA
jgi:hypothetical protein